MNNRKAPREFWMDRDTLDAALRRCKMNHDDLRRLALAATPGPWQSCNGYQGFGLIEGISKQHKVDVIVCDGTYDSQFTGVQKKYDADFIASANPQTILSLLDELAAMTSDRDVLDNANIVLNHELQSLRAQVEVAKEIDHHLSSLEHMMSRYTEQYGDEAKIAVSKMSEVRFMRKALTKLTEMGRHEKNNA